MFLAPAQVQRQREVGARRRRRRHESHAGRVAEGTEARELAALGLVGVDRHRRPVAAAGARDEILAAAERPSGPRVVNVKGQRRIHANGRVQRLRRLPRAVADARDELARRAGRVHRHEAAVAGHDVPALDGVVDLDLKLLHRRVDVADRAAGRAFLAEDVPRLERGAQLHVHAVVGDLALEREAEFHVRCEPLALERQGPARFRSPITSLRS